MKQKTEFCNMGCASSLLTLFGHFCWLGVFPHLVGLCYPLPPSPHKMRDTILLVNYNKITIVQTTVTQSEMKY